MASGDVTITHGTPAAATITLASLPTSATWVAGAESNAVVLAQTGDVEDYALTGIVTVGTTPTINTEIRVYVFATMDGSTYPDVFDGTASAETVTSAGVRDGFAKLAATMFVDSTTSNRPYYFGPVSIAQLFGGFIPQTFGIFITHNTGVNLNATAGNHAVTLTSKKRNVSP